MAGYQEPCPTHYEAEHSTQQGAVRGLRVVVTPSLPQESCSSSLIILSDRGFQLGWAPGSLVLCKCFKSLQLCWKEISALKIVLAYIVFPSIYLAHPLFDCGYPSA